MGLLSKTSKFLNKTVVGKAVGSLAPKSTDFIKSIAPQQKGAVKAINQTQVVNSVKSSTIAQNNSNTMLEKLKSFLGLYWVWILGGVVVSLLAYFFIFKKKKVVRKRPVRRK